MASYPWASSFMAYAFPCCECGGCGWTLPTVVLDGSDAPYADLTTAQTALTEQTISCLIQTDDAPAVTDLAAAVTGEVLDITESQANPPDNLGRTILARVKIAAACDLNLDYALTFDGTSGYAVNFYVYQDDGTTTEDSASASGIASGPTGTLTCTITAAGNYWVRVDAGQTPGGDPATTFSHVLSLYSADPITWCTIDGAKWDDSGTTVTEPCTP